MAGERTLPGLGLTGFWDLGDSTWKPGMDTNLLTLSVVGGATVDSREAAAPGAPTQGDIVIATTDWGATVTDQSIQAYDNSAWVEIAPYEGLLMYDKATDELLKYTGAAWEVFSAGGGGGGGDGVAVTNPAQYFQFSISADIAYGSGAFLDILFDTVEANTTGGSLDGATGGFLVPAALNGQVMTFSAGVRFNGVESGAMYFIITRAGGASEQFGAQHGYDSVNAASLPSATIKVFEGDLVTVKIFTGSAATMSSNSATFFSGFVVAGASQSPSIPFKGVRAIGPSNQAIPLGTSTVLDVSSVEFEEGADWQVTSAGFVVPEGVSYVVVDAGFQVDASPGAAEFEFFIQVNSSTLVYQRTSTGAWGGMTSTTGVIAVSPGDVIRPVLWSTDALTLRAARTFMAIQDVSFSAGMGGVVITEETAAFSVTEEHLKGNRYVEVNFGAAADITIPPDLIGSQPVTFEMTGAGVPSFVAGAGVTINSFGSLLDIAGTSGVVTLMPKGNNVFTLFGNLA